jgi:multidrug resistance protein, MATE family
LADGYMAALAWGVLPLMLFMAFRQFLEGRGIATPTMIITFLGLGVNFVGNTLLIYGVPEWGIPRLEVVGSGWSTTIVRWAMLGAMVYYVFRSPRIRPWGDVGFAWHGETIWRIVRIGAPTGAQIGLEVGLFSFAAVMVGSIDEVSLAAHQVTISLASTTFMVALGVSLAGAVRVGHSVGAQSLAGVRRAVLVTVGLALACMSVFALAFLFLRAPLLRLYTSEESIIQIGKQLLIWAAVFQIFDGLQVAAVSVLRGAADTRVPMIMAAVAYWGVGAPAALFFGFYWGFGAPGVWAGLCLSLVVASVLLGHRIRQVLWVRGGGVPPVRA